MKKIALVVRVFDRHGGLELYTHKVLEGILTAGLKVTVFCAEKKSDYSHANLEVVTLAEPQQKLDKAKRQRYNESGLNALLKGRRHEFDLVHSQNCPIEAPDLVTFHQHTAMRFSESGRALEATINKIKCRLHPAYLVRIEQDRNLCQNAVMRSFVSEICQKDYYSHYMGGALASRPFLILPPGADSTDNIAQADAPQVGKLKPFTFIFVGKGFSKKGLDTLFHACRILKQEKRDFKLLVIGLKNSLYNRFLAFKEGIDDRVQLMGFRKDLETLLPQASVIVVPSKCEAYGMSPVEAMTAGTPAIISTMAGVTEELMDGMEALHLKNHLDAAELARLMAKLMEDQNLYQTLQVMGKKKAAEITWQRTIKLTLEAYEKTLQLKTSGVIS
ncbi:MAG: glycosyltransferase family 4 protein [Candidatus Obscuribacterales bacterium]|nr:glycosyltransferase family 4 protein [Candidatus Obscuribacterales bacterium]